MNLSAVTCEWGSLDFGDPRLPDKFWSRVFPDPNTGCWLWEGSTNNKSGSAVFYMNGKLYTGHLLVAETMFGEWTDPKLIKRLPGADCCVAPQHIFRIDIQVCSRWHPMTPENTAKDGTTCRKCKSVSDARHRGARAEHARIMRANQSDAKRKHEAERSAKRREIAQREEARRKLENISVFGDQIPTVVWRPGVWSKNA